MALALGKQYNRKAFSRCTLHVKGVSVVLLKLGWWCWIEFSCVCLSWYLWGLHTHRRLFITAGERVHMCVCVRARCNSQQRVKDTTVNTRWLVVLLCFSVGGFYLLPDASNSSVSTTNYCKRHQNHDTQLNNCVFTPHVSSWVWLLIFNVLFI